MYKIAVCLLDREFEHDVFELIRAFYPEAEIHTFYEEAEGEFDLRFLVERDGDAFLIRYESEGKKGAASARRICGYDRPRAASEESAADSAVGESGEETADSAVSESGEETADSAVGENGEREGAHEAKERYLAVRKENKDSLKYALYQVLTKLTGRTLPWGNLTGIRPVKLATGMLESGMKNTEIAAVLQERYLVSREKTALAVAIANRERAILQNIDYENGYSLYVGIPFCPSICLYCSFSSYPLSRWEKRVDEYLDALCREIRTVSRLLPHRRPDTVYIGGGTPTTLTPDQLRRLLGTLGESFCLDGLLEFTVEAGRPDSITREKLLAIREFPVTRISVNPQTMNQETLDIIGRRHTVEQTREAFSLARETGYDNINMDLIVGLPGEDISMVEKTLSEIEKLSPDSLTVHSLAVKRAARLNIFRDKYREMTFENNQEILDRTMRAAYGMGMSPYYLYRQKNMKGNFENVGYARETKAGIYNILIMEEKQPIIALGTGGASKLVCDGGKRIERVENVKDVENYISRIDEMIARKQAGISAWLQDGGKECERRQ